MLTTSASLPASIGPYQVEGLLGQGGMARVYRALDPTLQRPVAIKLLTPVAAAVPGYADRFLQEARILAQLRHPNIVQVYDFGTHEGAPYMVQELLPGPTLEQQLRELAAQGRRLTPDAVTGIVGQLAAALDAAHARGVIHRDVKPGNAIWSGAGALVLTDFGIAKQTLAYVNQTQTGIVIGTPAYLSPEQAQGHPLTPASDVYALGVVLYELLAGVVPFPGATPLHIALAHVQALPPDLVAVRPDLPPAVRAVVRQALAKEPGARFHSAGALAHALAQAWAAPGVAPAGSIHNQPTQIWEGAPAVPAAALTPNPVPGAPSTAAPPSLPATGATIAQPATHSAPMAPSAPARAPGSRRLLPILGGLLAALFVLGALVAAFARDQGEALAPTTVAPAATIGADSASPAAPTAIPDLPPTVAPTAATAPVEAPPPDADAGGNGGNGNGGNGNGKDKEKKDK